ncbi:MAG: hypothetical protein JWQ43_3298 [Glaciihabitans sp.]|nr:hypothetical protein [Glaciihabitans sp.]
MKPRRGFRSSQTGSILPLTIFFGVLCLVLIVMVTAVTSLYLERKRLFTLADGAALAGAEAFELADVEVTVDGPRVTLDPGAVARAVDDYLEASPAERVGEITVDSANSPDGRSAEVTLSTFWRPPMVTLLIPEGLRIEVTALARPVFFSALVMP